MMHIHHIYQRERMIYMRISIEWKDSPNGHRNKPVKYRGYTIAGYKRAWITSFPNDRNIYKSHYCAENAIDAMLGHTHGKRGKPTEKRLRYGVQVIGQISEEEKAEILQ